MVTILFTADTHGLFRRQDFVEGIAGLKALLRPDLMLDAGDALEQWEWDRALAPEFAIMWQLGYQAIAVGNHEFHEFPERMREKMGSEAPELLGANLRHRKSFGRRDSVHKATWPISSSLIVDSNGITIGVLGLMTNHARPDRFRDRVPNVLSRPFLPARFENACSVVESQAEKMRSECDLVIVLSHAGILEDKLVAERCPGVDLILGGHTHSHHLPEGNEICPVVNYAEDADGREHRSLPRRDRKNAIVCLVALDCNVRPVKWGIVAYNVLRKEVSAVAGEAAELLCALNPMSGPG